MILIGQFDSPFVRRVGIALELYRLDYEHRPWSVFGNAEEIARYNPLIRVPTLVADDGEVLVETLAILDALDEMVGPDKALIPKSGPQRRRAMKVCALAGGLADKAVSLVYEQRVHNRATPAWVQRCETQINGALALLEQDRAEHHYNWWMGEAIGHADIAVAATLRFLTEAHPERFQIAGYPALAQHCERCEAMDEFQKISQSFYVAPLSS